MPNGRINDHRIYSLTSYSNAHFSTLGEISVLIKLICESGLQILLSRAAKIMQAHNFEM